MASIIRMPGISADAEEAVLLEWAADEGAAFTLGDALATVETEKANVDIEADQDGVLWRRLAEAGTSVSVGSPIAVVLETGEKVDDEYALLSSLGLNGKNAAPPAQAIATSTPDPGINVLGTVSAGRMDEGARGELQLPADAGTPAPARSGGSGNGRDGRVFASPLARRLAREYGLPVEDLPGSGPGGRITRRDVMAAVEQGVQQPTAAPPAETAPAAPSVQTATAAPQGASPAPREDAGGTYTDVPHSGLRRAVASALSASKRDAPHFYLSSTIRVDALLELRERINESSSVRVSINDLVLKAVAKSLRENPDMNVIWTDAAVRRFDTVDISVAIGSERGLVTPVIRGADSLTLTQLAAQVRDFAARANEGRLKQHELVGGTFTVTNLGMFGVENFSAIINPPQVGILAVGAVVKTPVVGEDDRIEVAKTMTVTVSADHRPVDGVLVAKWLQQFTNLMESPLAILT